MKQCDIFLANTGVKHFHAQNNLKECCLEMKTSKKY